jgi:hypothetical protein
MLRGAMLLENHVDLLAPYLAELFNKCQIGGEIPTTYRAAYTHRF